MESPFSRKTLAKLVASFGLVRPLCGRYQHRLLLGVMALGLVNLLQLLIPRVIKQAVDRLGGDTATDADLGRALIIIVGLALLVALLRFAWRYLILGFSRLLERDLRDLMFGHLLTLDLAFFQKRTTGAIMALASNDLAAVQMAAGMGLVAFADALLMSLATLGFMAYINPGLTMIAVLPLPVLAVLTSLLSARLHRRFKLVQEQFSQLTEFSRTSLAAIRLIKAYTLEGYQGRRFDRLGWEYVAQNLKLARLQGTLFPVAGLIASISLGLVLFFGGRLTIQKTISIGDFVAFISYLNMLTWPTMALGWVATLFQRGATSLSRLDEVFRARPQLSEPPAPRTLADFSGRISLRGLSYRHPGQLDDALSDLHLEFTPGFWGIVGRTGSGKSTLCHVLARLLPVADNRLFMDDVDVNRLRLSTVRSRIAYVPQEAVLFADTVAANIGFGAPEAPQDVIEAAARAAMIHGEIMAMPQGYETRIGEKGVTLSGGQRQRLALARALLLDRPVLIIDDGLAGVDTQTEHAIMEKLATYLKNRIAIIVSHRLAPLAAAEHLIVLEAGRVAAVGDHAELMAKSSYYRKIHAQQSGGGECNGPAGVG